MRFLRAIEFRQAGTIRLFYETCELKEGKKKGKKKSGECSPLFSICSKIASILRFIL